MNLLILYIIRTDVKFSDRSVTDTMQVKMYKTRKEGKKERREEKNDGKRQDSGKKQVNVSVFAP
jgi:hypothetical protein